MKKHLLLVSGILIIFLQCIQIKVIAQQKLHYHYIHPKAEYLGTYSPNEGIDWQIQVQNLEMPNPSKGFPGVNLEELKKLQKQLLQQHKTSKPRYNKSTNIMSPIIEFDTAGNPFNGSVPNDNDVAVSEDNIVISVKNTNVLGFDLNNKQNIYYKSLGALFLPLQMGGTKYDPRVIYDPDFKRFIVVCLKDYTYQNSKILLAFSTTSNPNDPWHFYALPGNPLNNNTWSDYPVIGINNNELFIGINTFFNGSVNNSGFHESCLWQIDKVAGFNGDSIINTRYYFDILTERNDSIFNITPISGGMGTYGPNMYLLSNENLALQNDTFYLLEVTNSLKNNPELTYRIIKSDTPYYLPVDADQAGNHFLQTNDSRVLGGFYENDRIFFVQNSTYPGNGKAAIYFGRISNIKNNPKINASWIYSDTMHLGFPNIAFTGINSCDNQCVISFCFSDTNVYAGYGCVFVNDLLEISPVKVIRKGDNYLNALSGNLERWGDYSGAQRLYQSPGKAFVAGCYGMSNNLYGTWMAQIASPEIGLKSEPFQTNVVLPSQYLACDAAVETQALWGQPPYLYSLNNQNSLASGNVIFGDLCAGTYILQATDRFDCMFYDTVKIDYTSPATSIFPNPAVNKVTLFFELQETGDFQADVFDLNGKPVLHLFSGTAKKGRNLFSFDASHLSAGTYIIKIRQDEKELATEKLIIQH